MKNVLTCECFILGYIHVRDGKISKKDLKQFFEEKEHENFNIALRNLENENLIRITGSGTNEFVFVESLT